VKRKWKTILAVPVLTMALVLLALWNEQSTQGMEAVIFQREFPPRGGARCSTIAVAVANYLEARGFSNAPRPRHGGSSGEQRKHEHLTETWYQGHTRIDRELFVRVELDRTESPFIGVYVSWRTTGFMNHIEAVRARGHELIEDLSAWMWKEYGDPPGPAQGNNTDGPIASARPVPESADQALSDGQRKRKRSSAA
jgi:hypothetical protein